MEGAQPKGKKRQSYVRRKRPRSLGPGDAHWPRYGRRPRSLYLSKVQVVSFAVPLDCAAPRALAAQRRGRRA